MDTGITQRNRTVPCPESAIQDLCALFEGSGKVFATVALAAIVSSATADDASAQIRAVSAPSTVSAGPPGASSGVEVTSPETPDQGPVQGRAVLIQPSISIGATATSNAGASSLGEPRRDLIVDMRPEVFIRARSARYTLDGTMGLSLTKYINDTQPNRATPVGRLDLTSTLVENTLFLDAGIGASKTVSNVFGQQPGGTSTNNSGTTADARLSPYLSSEIAPDLFVLARSDNLATNTFGSKTSLDVQGDVRHQSNLVRIDRRPVPAGVTLELTTDDSKFSGQPIAALSQRSVRVEGKVALSLELLAGVIGGHETSDYFLQRINANRYGVMLNWRPTERTIFDAEVEHRFFGYGWNIHFRHRNPLAAFDVTLLRTASALPASLASSSASADLAGLLDAVFTTRIPNENERASLVHDTLRARGLGGVQLAAVDVFTQYAQVRQDAAVRAVLNSARNIVAISAFYSKATALQGSVLPSAVIGNDIRQFGTGIDFSRALSKDTTGLLDFAVKNVYGLGSRSSDFAREKTLQLSINTNLTPRSTLNYGARRSLVQSTTLPPPGSESAGFARYSILF